MKNRFSDYNHEVQEAVEAFERVQSENEERYFDVEELILIIDFYLDGNNLDELEEALLLAESLYPDHNEFKLRRGQLFCAKGNPDKALTLLNEIIQEEPENTECLYVLGVCFSMMDQPRKAIRFYQKAATDGHALDIVYGNIGDEYSKLGETDNAINYFRRALKVNPDEDRSLSNLTMLLVGANRTDAAIKFLEHFTQENPFNEEAWYHLGYALHAQNKLDEAIDAFQFCITADKKHIDAYRDIALCYAEKQDYGKAVSELLEAIPYTDDPAELYLMAGDIYMLYAQNHHAAIVYYKQATERDPAFDRAWRQLSECYLHIDDPSAALSAVEKALQYNPNEPNYLCLAGNIYGYLNNFEKAKEIFQLAIETDPTSGLAYLQLAHLFFQEGNYREALDMIESSEENMADSGYTSNSMARTLATACHFRLGHIQTVKQMLIQGNHIPITVPIEPGEASEGAIDFATLLQLCPEMNNDIEIQNILQSK